MFLWSFMSLLEVKCEICICNVELKVLHLFIHFIFKLLLNKCESWVFSVLPFFCPFIHKVTPFPDNRGCRGKLVSILGLLDDTVCASSRRLQIWPSTAARSLSWRRPRESRRKRLSHGTARWVSNMPSKDARAPWSHRDYLENVRTYHFRLGRFFVITSLFFFYVTCAIIFFILSVLSLKYNKRWCLGVFKTRFIWETLYFKSPI